MMNIEKSLAQTDLNQFKTEPLKQLVKQIYKYQNFKAGIILEKINRANYSEATTRLYINKIKQYLKTGIRVHSTPTSVYKIIDELKAVHTPILTPSESERAQVYYSKYSKLATNPAPVSVEPPKYIDKIPPQYGVMCENKIILQPSKEMALGYLECYKIIGDGKAVKLVTVDIEEIEV